MKIGLSLSGGGFRATVFHLGVLARLAEEGLMEEVTCVSTVSGGSLCASLAFAQNGFRWPSSTDLIHKVIPQARQLLTTQDLQLDLIRRVLRLPVRLLDTRADDLSWLLQKRWGVTGSLGSLPEHPRWLINATCYETGQSWHFERSRMGDGMFGYSHDTDIPLSDAVAASCGFPGLIGALAMDTGGRSWFRYGDPWQATEVPIQPSFRRIHLWDGGVSDNLGVEALHSFLTGWQQDVDMLIVSDGCSSLRSEPYRLWKAADRMVRGIMMEQIRTLRFRSLLERFVNHSDPGCYVQIGRTCEDVLSLTGRQEWIGQLGSDCLGTQEVNRAAAVPTTITRLSQDTFELLFRHGFEVADCTMCACQPDQFSHIGYRHSSRQQAPPQRVLPQEAGIRDVGWSIPLPVRR
jgi:NTE family protein